MDRVVVLISGSGSNLAALLAASADCSLPARIVAVISNRAEAYGLVRAQEAGVPTVCLPYRRGTGRERYDAELARVVGAFRPKLVVLAGWMRILTPAFLDQFPRRVINLHPALPGRFDGTHAIERAYAAWQAGAITHSGCMVHYAIPQVDAGEVIMQQAVPFEPGDTPEQFAARMHAAEHRLIVAATCAALEQLSGVTPRR
jgi:formyltetrahydrofolate-dependent phosphoribosylglycinamide formyltransferase